MNRLLSSHTVSHGHRLTWITNRMSVCLLLLLEDGHRSKLLPFRVIEIIVSCKLNGMPSQQIASLGLLGIGYIMMQLYEDRRRRWMDRQTD